MKTTIEILLTLEHGLVKGVLGREASLLLLRAALKRLCRAQYYPAAKADKPTPPKEKPRRALVNRRKKHRRKRKLASVRPLAQAIEDALPAFAGTQFPLTEFVTVLREKNRGLKVTYGACARHLYRLADRITKVHGTKEWSAFAPAKLTCIEADAAPEIVKVRSEEQKGSPEVKA